VARAIEQRSREVEDRDRLATNMQSLVDLLSEADFIARRNQRSCVDAADVEKALEHQTHRADRLATEVSRSIARGLLLIDTEGSKVGQVNGLATYSVGGQIFGKPTRITASARVGDGQVIDVQREAQLGGPIHAKGVMILSSFLAARFSRKIPHSLRASIVFEQIYSEVEGDSASAAELCALLSALAGAGICQAIAITGSVNQYGEMQAVGAVNEKIEGFFDVCKTRNGVHGVIIPSANVQNLMLRADVVAAAERGEFHIYPADSVDDAIEILTGMPAGRLSDLGEFPAGSVNALVAERLHEFSGIRQVFGATAAPTHRLQKSAKLAD